MSYFFKKILIVLFLLNSFLSFSLYKQDSLLRVLDTAKNNKVIVKTMMNLWYYHYEKNDLNKAFDWIQKARKYAFSINDSALIFTTTANTGIHYDFCQNYGAALYNYKLSIKYIKKDKQYYDRLINMRLTIANAFKKTKQLDRVKNEFDSIEVYLNKLDKIKDASTFFSFYASKANYYKEILNIDSSLKYFDLAIYNFKEEFQYVLSETDSRQQLLFKYAELNKDWATLNKSLIDKHYDEYKALYNKNRDNISIPGHNNFLILTANHFFSVNKMDSVKIYYNKILKLNKNNITPDFNINVLELALKIAIADNNFNKVTEITNKIKLVKDSTLIAVQANNLNSTELFFESEEQASFEKLNAQKAQIISEESKQRNRTILICSIFIVIILLVGILLLRNRYKLEQKQKHIIEIKSKETEEQKFIIEQKAAELSIINKEITDSINYAERIQRALLASKKVLDENLNDYFILFKPKNIISGDFYWATKLSNDSFVLVTADSTGHGVPGAIMSILNIACLDKTVTKGITSPDAILNETRSLIIENLKNDGSLEGGKDGMDGNLLSFDFNNNILRCASANNPVWIVRSGNLIEIKADRFPIGKHDKDKTPFTLHTLELQKGDVIYSFTDGFPDQFGGPNGKKFKHKKLQELLLSISDESMSTQKQKLNDVFDNWKGDLEQVDDVSLIGIRI